MDNPSQEEKGQTARPTLFIFSHRARKNDGVHFGISKVPGAPQIVNWLDRRVPSPGQGCGSFGSALASKTAGRGLLRLMQNVQRLQVRDHGSRHQRPHAVERLRRVRVR